MEHTYSVFIRTDKAGRVTAVDSSAFIKDPAGWIFIDEGDGEKYTFAQSKYLSKTILDENFCYRYKYIDGEIIERSEEERAADIPEPVPSPPTNAELEARNAVLEAQVTDLQMAICELYEEMMI